VNGRIPYEIWILEGMKGHSPTIASEGERLPVRWRVISQASKEDLAAVYNVALYSTWEAK